MWKIYSGSKKSTRQSAAVFVLEKRALEIRFPDKTERETILEQCRKAVAQLTRLKHPQVLTVQVRVKYPITDYIYIYTSCSILRYLLNNFVYFCVL